LTVSIPKVHLPAADSLGSAVGAASPSAAKSAAKSNLSFIVLVGAQEGDGYDVGGMKADVGNTKVVVGGVKADIGIIKAMYVVVAYKKSL
jgi:hypothetical protein